MTSSPNPTSPTWCKRRTRSSSDGVPELSVVVPVYNEEATIASFLGLMALQREVRMEVVIVDGGSTDNSVASISAVSDTLPFPVSVVSSAKGRARQLNLGARASRAEILLFLHIDSSLPDPLALRKGVDALLQGIEKDGPAVAGHFALQFEFASRPPLPYRFYGAKAALDRRGCTHGDQGMMLAKRFFEEVGPFDQSLPLLEDTFLADSIREKGKWLLLPASITTSPRRFLTEGLLPRQTLNAIIMNLAAIGRMELVESLKGCYRSQDAAGNLDLAPFLLLLRDRIAQLPRDERRRLWHDTGSYVRCNAWQIPFFLDVLRGKREGNGGAFLALHDRFFDRVTANAVCNWFTAALVWLWFRALLKTGR